MNQIDKSLNKMLGGRAINPLGSFGIQRDRRSRNERKYKIGDKVKFNYNIVLDERNENDVAIKNTIGVIIQIDSTSEYPYYVKFGLKKLKRLIIKVK